MKTKPCPFCGKKPKYIVFGEWVQLKCTNKECRMKPSTGDSHHRDKVQAVWNTRSLDPNYEAALDLLSDVYSHYENTGVEYGGVIPSTIYKKIVKFLNPKSRS